MKRIILVIILTFLTSNLWAQLDPCEIDLGGIDDVWPSVTDTICKGDLIDMPNLDMNRKPVLSIPALCGSSIMISLHQPTP